MSEKEAYEMTYMLEGVIDHGTGTGAAIGRPAAGKTGTTDNNVDAWFSLYADDRHGRLDRDDSGSHSLGEVYGGTIPAAIWRDYMTVATQDESYEASPSRPAWNRLRRRRKKNLNPKRMTKKTQLRTRGRNRANRQRKTTNLLIPANEPPKNGPSSRPRATTRKNNILACNAEAASPSLQQICSAEGTGLFYFTHYIRQKRHRAWPKPMPLCVYNIPMILSALCAGGRGEITAR